jgi:hypothetical protein
MTPSPALRRRFRSPPPKTTTSLPSPSSLLSRLTLTAAFSRHRFSSASSSMRFSTSRPRVWPRYSPTRVMISSIVRPAKASVGVCWGMVKRGAGLGLGVRGMF